MSGGSTNRVDIGTLSDMTVDISERPIVDDDRDVKSFTWLIWSHLRAFEATLGYECVTFPGGETGSAME